MNDRSNIKIWKLQLSTDIAPNEIENAVFDASSSFGLSDYVEILRIDNYKEETRVFIAGNEKLAERLSKTMKLRSPSTESQFSEAKADELFEFPK